MMENNIVLQESDLELVVSEKTLGSLTTNAKQIRDLVKSSLPKYDISNYNDSNIDQAKKDKAVLNKAAKALNAKRLEIEKEFMKPFGEFKEIVAETVKLITECSAKIDAVVKENEQQYKNRKLEDIRTYFEAVNKNSVDFDKIYNPSWLNKSSSMKSVCNEIDSALSRIDSEINSLKGLSPEDFDVLQTYYMDTLNLSSTIQYANRLKEHRERAHAAEEVRIKAAEEEKLLKASQEEMQRNNDVEHQSVHSPAPSEDSSHVKNEEQAENAPENSKLYVRAFKVTATKEQIIALGDYMNENNIDFEKIEL